MQKVEYNQELFDLTWKQAAGSVVQEQVKFNFKDPLVAHIQKDGFPIAIFQYDIDPLTYQVGTILIVRMGVVEQQYVIDLQRMDSETIRETSDPDKIIEPSEWIQFTGVPSSFSWDVFRSVLEKYMEDLYLSLNTYGY